MASSDDLDITLTGKQTHGAMPWNGIDTVTLAAQIIEALNAISSRQLDPTEGPTVITIATVRAGTRRNIIPESVLLGGTLRTFGERSRQAALAKITRTVTDLADSWGARGQLAPDEDPYPVVYNEPVLTDRMLASLERAAGRSHVRRAPPVMASEDFGFYQQRFPGLYYFLGISAAGVAEEDTPPNHSPYFTVNEQALETGVRAHVILALDYLEREHLK